MSGREEPQDADPEEVRSTLSEGLRACRAIVSGYRHLIMDEAGGVPIHPAADNDQRLTAND